MLPRLSRYVMGPPFTMGPCRGARSLPVMGCPGGHIPGAIEPVGGGVIRRRLALDAAEGVLLVLCGRACDRTRR